MKVSAIVSVYNSERFIEGCIEDLLSQTLYRKGSLEIVLVNTGSTQNEDPIIREYEKKYHNIIYVRVNQRETVYQAWNRGIKAATGEYIANANTDDRHRKDALEILANELDRNPQIALVYADSLITGKANDSFATHKPKLALNYPEYDRNTLLKWCCIGPQPMWRKSVHDEFGYFSDTYRVAGDYEFWLRISQKYPFKHVKDYLGLFYKSGENLEFQNMETSHTETFEIQERYNNLGTGTVNEYVESIRKHLDTKNLVAADIVSSIGTSKHADDAEIWLMRAMVLRKIGKPSDALDAISVSIQNHETVEALRELVEIHEAAGKSDYSTKVREYIRQRYPRYAMNQT